jgi:hypothetical protein
MGYGDDVAALNKRLSKVVSELDGSGMSRRLQRLGKEAAADAIIPILAATPGKPTRGGRGGPPGALQGWSHRKPRILGVRAYMRNPREVAVEPNRGSRGQMRILEDGRQPHEIGEGLLRFRMSKTKGLRMSHKVVGAKSGRRIGSQAGKKVWTEAETLMVARTQKRSERGFEDTLRKIFIGG